MKLLRRAMYMDGTEPSLWKGLIAGAVGGLAGTVAMSAFQELWRTAQNEIAKEAPAAPKHIGNGHQKEESCQTPVREETLYLEASEDTEAQRHARAGRSGNGSTQKNEPPADGPLEKTAAGIASLARIELSPGQKHQAGLFVHYAFGTLLGAAYGASVELAPELLRKRRPTPWLGLGYGSAVFLGADEIALPTLELTGKVTEMPISSHVYGFASHLVYGLVAELTRRVVRKSL